MSREDWTSIPGFDGVYEATSDGKFRRNKRTIVRKDGQIQGIGAKEVPLYTDRLGYKRVDIQYNGYKKSYLAHRLIALTFLGEPPDAEHQEINHKDADKSNISAENLEWCSREENIRHAYRLGLIHFPSGEENSRSIPVLMLDKGTGACLQKFTAVHEAARFLGGKKYATKISACCKGRRKSAYGYRWQYATKNCID